MNILFTIKVHNFEKAAQIEKSLKELGISYETKVDDKPSLGSGKRITPKARITKSELAAVINTIHKWPKASDVDIAHKCNVSSATIGRIRNGKHTLQINGSPDIEKDI